METQRHRTPWSLWRGMLGLGSGLGLLVLGGWFYMIFMPGHSYTGPLLPLTAVEAEIRQQLVRHITMLAGDIGERHLWRLHALEATGRYLETVWQATGYAVTRQTFSAYGKTVANLAVELRGTSHAEEIVVVGGHYDSVVGSPGANDNASGTAAVLEIARVLAGQRLARTIRFVAFVNEETPFFQSDAMGSWVYARQARAHGDKIVAMFSLETMGYYSDAKGSQRYPLPFGLFYPTIGNFIGFVGNTTSRSLVRHSIKTFRQQPTVPSEGVAAPGWLTGVGWSDHWAFWQEGYPGVMVTDTALFRYPYYHTMEDTPDKIDYGRLARVVAGLARVVTELAGVPTP